MMSLLVLALAIGDLAQKPAAPAWTPAKKLAIGRIDEQSDAIRQLARTIWNYSELAFQERQSSKALADALEQRGFRVERGVAGMPTAFLAEFGEGKPIVAILAEFDALPGLSQEATPYQQPAPRRTAGHGCGHNLFGAASVGAAIGVQHAMKTQGIPGTIRVYGCPAEEGGGGKVYLVREGAFREVDAALHWHPSTDNDAGMNSCLAVVRFRMRFRGRAAHAASAENGRSALDAVELMNVGVNYLREHVTPQARIHYVITDGGHRPNVVPEFAEVWYYIRAPRMEQARAIHARVLKVAEGAGLMTETEGKSRLLSGTHELIGNAPLAQAMHANLHLIGPPKFSEEERAFATELRKNLGIANAQDLRAGAVGPLNEAIPAKLGAITGSGSTDVGDISWNVPTAGLRVATAAQGVPGHSWSFTACAGHPLGERGALVAAKTLACTALDCFQTPSLMQAARQDFARRRAAAGAYEPVLEPGPPPERLDDE